MSTDARMETLDRLTGIVAATLRLPPGKVDVDVEMTRLGIDSIIAMELIDAIGRAFPVSISPAQFAAIATLRELAQQVHAEAQAMPQPSGGTQAAVSAISPASAPVTTPTETMLDFVHRTYSIDLSGGSFGSIDELADALVAGHADELLRHYGLPAPALAHASSADGIAIVGLGCRLPDAPDARAFWANLLAETCSVREIPASRWCWQDHFADTPTPGKTVSKWGALIDDVDCFDAPFFGMQAAEADAMDPQLRLLLEQTWHALEDAGLDPRSLAGSRTGVFVGYQYAEYEQYLRRFEFQRLADGPLFSSSSPTYYLANRISFAFDLRGPSEAINVNCASSAVAINRAWHALANGECDVAIAAGVSLNLFAQDYIASSQYGLLSPDGTSGVFDEAACGFTRGEGVGVLVMRRASDATRERDRIYALIKGCHENYRGAARSLSEVRHESIADVLASCHRRASVEPATVRYIEVDGYATKWADSFEFEGVKEALMPAAPSAQSVKRCALGSVKGNIGNVEAASGVVNVIKVALSLHHGRFPATLSKRTISSFIDIDSAEHPLYIADHPIGFDGIREGETPVRAGVNSFADSGTNVHIVLEEHREGRMQASGRSGDAPIGAPAAPRLFVLSARDAGRLTEYVRRYVDFLASGDVPASFENLIYTAQTGRTAFVERLAVVAASHEALRDKLARIAATGLGELHRLDALGIYHGRLDATRVNPLAGLIGEDIATLQLERAVRTGQWEAVAQLWVNGVAMPWRTMWATSAVRPVTLPGYPFARERHWIEADSGRAAAREVPPSALRESVGFVDTPSPEARPTEALPLTPARAIERLLQSEVARQLRRSADSVPIDRDFIELGMTSIAIAELIQRIDVLLGLSLAPSTIFRYPRIDALAAHLVQVRQDPAGSTVASTSTQSPRLTSHVTEVTRPHSGDAHEASALSYSDLLIAIQSDGDATPIFALPGAGGGALSLHQLGHALGAGQPFYCIEAAGLDGRTPPMTQVEAIAERNIALLRTIQPQGPYRLLGYSNGGVVAFEMACQLAAHGTPAAMLVLLDTLCPTLRDDDISEMTAAVFRHFVGSLGASTDLDARALRQVSEHARSGHLFERLTALGLAVPRTQFVATFDAATASERACRAYAPQSLPLSGGTAVLLVRARDGFSGAPHDYGWGAFAGGALQIREVDGNHFSLLEPGPVVTVAQWIRSVIGPCEQESANRVTPPTELTVSE